MGGALLRGWVKKNIGPITVVDPRQSELFDSALEVKDVVNRPETYFYNNLSEVTNHAPFSVCVVAIKPQTLKHDAHTLASFAESGALMISIAAGIHSKTLKHAWGDSARIVRAMPNTPGAIGYGITGLFALPEVTKDDRKLANKLLGALGKTVWVDDEDFIDIVTAISGSGPAYLFLVAEALIEAGVDEGLPLEVSEKLARATILGAGALLRSDKSPAKVLREAVTSPGGTTAAAIEVLLTRDLPSLMKSAVKAARKRAEELR
jgi:pyrroline-5-carboxylate reductase